MTMHRFTFRNVGSGLRGFVVVGLAPLLLAACMSDRIASYTDIQSSREADVIWVDLPHEIMFDVGEHHLSSLEEERLSAFLSDVTISPTDSVVIDPGSTRGGIVEPRIESLAEFLDGHIPESAISISHLGWAETDERMRIIIGRYIVTPPDCPNFQMPSHRNSNNLESSNHGCATATNLALMVADPADLMRGRKPSRPDGFTYTDSVTRYRAGAVREVAFPSGLASDQ